MFLHFSIPSPPTPQPPELALPSLHGLVALDSFRAAIEVQVRDEWERAWWKLADACRRFEAAVGSERDVARFHAGLRSADAAAREIYGLEPREWYDEQPPADRDRVLHVVPTAKMLLLTFGTPKS
jgi:hypothetical protein